MAAVFSTSTAPIRSRAELRWRISSRWWRSSRSRRRRPTCMAAWRATQKQGWTLFGAMAILFFMGVTTAYYFEAKPNPVMQGLAVDQAAGNMEGKEVRYRRRQLRALGRRSTTDASNGSVNSMHDSFNPHRRPGALGEHSTRRIDLRRRRRGALRHAGLCSCFGVYRRLDGRAHS